LNSILNFCAGVRSFSQLKNNVKKKKEERNEETVYPSTETQGNFGHNSVVVWIQQGSVNKMHEESFNRSPSAQYGRDRS